MTRTQRCWDRANFYMRGEWWITNYAQWKFDARYVFGRYREKRIRKNERHSIRCQNRTRFAHGIDEPYLSCAMYKYYD